jgi:hypothetical protein
MKNWYLLRLIGPLGVLVSTVAFCAAAVNAQEVSLEDLVLMRTSIKTGGSVFFSSTPVEALTPTTVTCPGGCTLRIQLSSQFSSVPNGSVAAVSVVVDGSPIGVLPSNAIGFDSTSNSGASNVRTFTWVKQDVANGKHTVRVFLFLAGAGTAGSFSRTLTVDAYKP